MNGSFPECRHFFSIKLKMLMSMGYAYGVYLCCSETHSKPKRTFDRSVPHPCWQNSAHCEGRRLHQDGGKDLTADGSPAKDKSQTLIVACTTEA